MHNRGSDEANIEGGGVIRQFETHGTIVAGKLVYSPLMVVNSHQLTGNGRLYDSQTGGTNENDSEANAPVNEDEESGVLSADRGQDGWTEQRATPTAVERMHTMHTNVSQSLSRETDIATDHVCIRGGNITTIYVYIRCLRRSTALPSLEIPHRGFRSTKRNGLQ